MTQKEDFERAAAKTLGVIAAIEWWYAANRHKGEAQGTVSCPICKGTLYLGISYNGHRKGRCDTPQCVSWME